MMMVMIIAVLTVLGLCFGSFVEALTWRLHQQDLPKKKRAASDKELSIATGRSMCPHCKHTLGALDLIPLFSWIALRGRCRYCKTPIGWQAPAIEAFMATLFVVSYAYWPRPLEGLGLFEFVLWLPALVGLVALLVYDLRWMLLPNRIVYPLTGLALIQVLGAALFLDAGFQYVLNAGFGLLIAGGIFYVLFQISKGEWIGGGDVKLGFALGLILGSATSALMMLFIASLLGTLVALPGLVSKRLSRTSKLPFGPFLIIATIIIVLFGANLDAAYESIINNMLGAPPL